MSTVNHPNQTITTQIGREAIIQKDCRSNKNIPILGEGAVDAQLLLQLHLASGTIPSAN